MGATDLSVLPQRSVVFPETVFRSSAVGDVPLRVEGIVGQTGHLQQWYNGDGELSVRVEGDGIFSARASAIIMPSMASRVGLLVQAFPGSTTQSVIFSQSDGTSNFRINSDGLTVADKGMFIYGTGAASRPLTIRGRAGQTANLQEWQTSTGAILSSIDSDGILRPNGRINYTQNFLFGGGL